MNLQYLLHPERQDFCGRNFIIQQAPGVLRMPHLHYNAFLTGDLQTKYLPSR